MGWNDFPMGTQDVMPGWNVQMLCPLANEIAEQACRPHIMDLSAVPDVIYGQADLSDNLTEGIAATIVSTSSVDSESNYQQSTAGMSGGTAVSGQNS